MVKPPRTMQPEAHKDIAKAGRAKTKSFDQDSFHNYMARKITLQREQFGVKLPPPPLPSSSSSLTKQPSSRLLEPKPPPSLIRHGKNKPSPSPSRVRFAPGSKAADSSTERKKRNSTGDSGMNEILKRLKRRHGKRTSFERKSRTEKSSETTTHAHRPLDQKAASVQLTGETRCSPQTDSPIVTDSNSQKNLARSRPDLFFLGVVVMVNGDTNPDSETLQRLLHRHGGDLEKYETSRVTHIIAEHLSFAKSKMYKSQKNPRPVVYPKWIVDSINAQRQLPLAPYLLNEFRRDDEKSQPSLLSFFPMPSKKTETKPKQAPSPPPNLCDTSKPTLVLSQKFEAAVGRDEIDTDVGITDSPKETPAVSMGNNEGPSKSAVGEVILLDQQEEECLASNAPKLDARSDHAENLSFDGDHMDDDDDEVDPKFSVDDHDAKLGIDEVARVHEGPVEEANSAHRSGSPMYCHGSNALSPEDQRVPSSRTDAKYINGRLRTVGTDPNFLDSFFQNSRLSYIGSYKQRTRTKRKPPSPKKAGLGTTKMVFHVDMDCFFAAVALRKFPQYHDAPVVISHFGTSNGGAQPEGAYKDSTSECATCNYEARKYGIKKGMYLGRAIQLCPTLKVLKYDFEGYQEVSGIVSDILDGVANRHWGIVEEISCDEAYMALNFESTDEDSLFEKAATVAKSIRSEIFESTQCTATVGVASNKFLAKLATDKVKPDGFFVARDYRPLLQPLQLRDLHGIGYRSEPKLRDAGLVSVEDVWRTPGARCVLQQTLGEQLGMKVFQFCQGQDDRPVEYAERKTIGAECNYGVRFNGQFGVEHMINGLAKEVERRMNVVGMKGSKVTLKVKQRKPNAPPPPKFLGHGSCFNISKSMDIRSGKTRDHSSFAKIGSQLFSQLKVDVADLRGMGITISNLAEDSAEDSGIRKWFSSSKAQKTPTSGTPNSRLAAEPPKCTNENSALADALADFASTSRPASEHSNSTKENTESADPFGAIDTYSEDGAGSPASEPIDIDIPPLSQIHMSQVEALPSPMRLQVEKKLKEESTSKEVEPRRKRTKVPRVASLFDSAAARSASQQNSERQSTKGRPETSKNQDEPYSERIPVHHEIDFYRDNLLPLTEYLDENPPSEKNIAHVAGFFYQLIDDNWLSDVNYLLKAVKRRKDEWGEEAWNTLHRTITKRLKTQLILH